MPWQQLAATVIAALMDPESDVLEADDLLVIDNGRAAADVVNFGLLDAWHFHKLFLDAPRAQR
jgi:hypothetical protein